MSLWQKCVVVLLSVGIFGSGSYFARIVFRPPELERYKSIPWVTYIHPNIKKLQRAQVLISQGNLQEAQTILVEALITAPKSPVTRELRDLLGNVNTRIFFSKEPSPWKTEYIVKRGDTLASIARKLESSPEAIIRVNDLDSTLIRPGEKLMVPRLDFTLTIDLPSNRVIVSDSHGFFAQYPIASADLPRSRISMIQTAVSAKSSSEQANLQPDRDLQKKGPPRINLRRAGYMLYGTGENKVASSSDIAVDDNDSEAAPLRGRAEHPPQGIALPKEDIAEIDLLVRKGTPVTIIRN